MKLTREQIEGLIRHTLTSVGTVVVMLGLASEGYVTELIGGLTAAVGFVWSFVDKLKRG